jgi:hypothetical protein
VRKKVIAAAATGVAVGTAAANAVTKWKGPIRGHVAFMQRHGIDDYIDVRPPKGSVIKLRVATGAMDFLEKGALVECYRNPNPNKRVNGRWEGRIQRLS